MLDSSNVGDLMSTALICVRDTDTIDTARREMQRAAIHHLPVVDEHQNLIGILSSNDLFGRRRKPPRNQRVGKSMSRTVVTGDPAMSALRALELMAQHSFHSLPVVAGDGHLVGIVTDVDLLSAQRKSPERATVGDRSR